MTEPQFYDCLRTSCWISSNLLKKRYEAFWPLQLKQERSEQGHVWNFYVKWKNSQGSHANGVLVCDIHHEAIKAMWQDESRRDVRQQEVTDEWLIRVNSQMTDQ